MRQLIYTERTGVYKKVRKAERPANSK